MKNVSHKLVWAMKQLQLMAIDNSDVNPPEKLFSDGGTLPGRASESLILKSLFLTGTLK